VVTAKSAYSGPESGFDDDRGIAINNPKSKTKAAAGTKTFHDRSPRHPGDRPVSGSDPCAALTGGREGGGQFRQHPFFLESGLHIHRRGGAKQ